jgi:hypothetical protein
LVAGGLSSYATRDDPVSALIHLGGHDVQHRQYAAICQHGGSLRLGSQPRGHSRLFFLFRSVSRLGCTRFGSSGIFGVSNR